MKTIENIKKWDIAKYDQFLLLQQLFQKSPAVETSEIVCMSGRALILLKSSLSQLI